MPAQRTKWLNEHAGIMSLPREVHAYVISKLDGVSLAKAKKVCRLWYDVVQDFERCFNIWLIRCIQEIPLYILVEISGLHEIYECVDSASAVENLKKLPWMFWKEVYSEHMRCNYLTMREKVEKTELCYYMGYGMVTSLAFLDNILFSGHEDGRVSCWKNIATEMECTMCHKHQRMVTDLAVTTAGQTVNHLLLGINNLYVISASEDSSLIVNDITSEKSTKINYFSKKVNTVSCSGLSFIGGASGSFLQGHPIWEINFTGELSAKARVKLEIADQETSNIVCAALHRNKAVVGNDLGKLYQYKWTDNGDSVQEEKPVCLTQFSSTPKTLVMKENNIVCLTDDGHVCVSRNSGSFKKHNVYEALERVPECLAWQRSILAIGAQTGLVYLYLIKEEKDLDTLSLEHPIKTLKLDSEHINAIAIGDDGAGPVVAVATEDYSITVFRWNKS